MNSNYRNSIFFVETQVPDFKILYKTVNNEVVPEWSKSLKYFLSCHKDCSNELRFLLGETKYNIVNDVITEIIDTYIKNADFTGIDEFRVLDIDAQLIKNRITAKTYQAYKDGADIVNKLKSLIQANNSPYWFLLNPQEERAICTLYHACQMDFNNNGVNEEKEKIFSIAYTLLTLRIRKAYSVYEHAVCKYRCINDAVLAAVAGFARVLNEYDFTTPIETGLGPWRLGLPIYDEISAVLQDVTPFRISVETVKKIYAYNPNIHGHMTREELMKEFSCSSATVDLMLAKDNRGNLIVSLDDYLENEDNEYSLSYSDESLELFEINNLLKNTLTEEEIMVFDYSFNQKLTYEQISKILGMTARQVKYRMEICKKKLKKAYMQ